MVTLSRAREPLHFMHLIYLTTNNTLRRAYTLERNTLWHMGVA